MSEVKLPSIHVDTLNDLSKCVCRKMEIAWYLIDNDCSLNKTSFLVVHCMNSLLVNLINTIGCILEMSILVHLILISC